MLFLEIFVMVIGMLILIPVVTIIRPFWVAIDPDGFRDFAIFVYQYLDDLHMRVEQEMKDDEEV